MVIPKIMLTRHKQIHRHRAGLLLALLVFIVTTALGQELSGRFKASVMVANRTEASAQALYGHAFLRMQYPAEHLDYIFTLETLNDSEKPSNIIIGNYNTRMMAFETKDYIEKFAEQNRTIAELPLNLTEHEIQTLWRVLDETITDSTQAIPADFFTNGCSSELTQILLRCIEGGVEFDPEVSDSIGRTKFQLGAFYRTQTSWHIVALSFFTTEVMHTELPPHLVAYAPVALPYIFSHAYIVDGDGRRPLLSQRTATIYAPDHTISNASTGQVHFFPQDTHTPMAIYLLALAVLQIVVCLTFRRLLRPISIVLFATYNLIFLLLLLVSWQTSIVELRGWNWQYLFYNPVPLLLWLRGRVTPFSQKTTMTISHVMIAWSVLCTATMAASPDMFLPEQPIITAVFAIQIVLERYSHKLNLLFTSKNV